MPDQRMVRYASDVNARQLVSRMTQAEKGDRPETWQLSADNVVHDRHGSYVHVGEGTMPSHHQAFQTPHADELAATSESAGQHALLMAGTAILVGILNYVLNIVMGWNLTVEEYGRVGVSQTMILLSVWFLSAGFPWIVSRAVARAGGAGPLDSEAGASAWRTYKTAWVANIALALFVVGIISWGFSSRWLGLEPSYAPLVVAVAVTVMALGISVVPDAALQGLLRFRRLAFIRITEAVVNTVLSVSLVLLGFGALGALGGFAAATLLACCLSVWAVSGHRFWHARGWGGMGALGEAVPMTLAVFGGIILTNIDLLAIKFLSTGANSDALSGAYQVAAVLARAPFFIATALVGSFYPRIARDSIAENSAADATESQHTHGSTLIRWLTLVVLPMHVILIVAAPAVVSFFFPERYSSSAPVLAVLALASAFLAIASGLAALLQGSGRTRIAAGTMTLAVVVQLSALWWLVPALGLLGAAIASALAGAMACSLLIFQVRALRITPPRLGRQGAAFGLLALSLLPLTIFFSEAGRLLIAAWIGASAALYIVATLYLGLVRADELEGVGASRSSGYLMQFRAKVARAARMLERQGSSKD
jgi:O-antigen/teichoic acid export membrane protein